MAGARGMAGLLLTGFLLLTMAPVCGSASDTDSQACCERHGCDRSGSKSKAADGVHLRGQEPCASRVSGSRSRNGSPEDCCRRGDLVYPVARAQSVYQHATSLPALSHIPTHTCSSLPGTLNLSSRPESISPPGRPES